MIASSALVVLVSLVLSQPDPTTGHVAMAHSASTVFDAEPPISNEVLAHSYGTGALTLAPGTSRQMVDERSRADFQTFGAISRSQMDVWWGTTGATLIASAVRAPAPPS